MENFENKLPDTLKLNLKDNPVDSKDRRKFIKDEIIFTDGKPGKHTAELIFKALKS